MSINSIISSIFKNIDYYPQINYMTRPSLSRTEIFEGRKSESKFCNQIYFSHSCTNMMLILVCSITELCPISICKTVPYFIVTFANITSFMLGAYDIYLFFLKKTYFTSYQLVFLV